MLLEGCQHADPLAPGNEEVEKDVHESDQRCGEGQLKGDRNE